MATLGLNWEKPKLLLMAKSLARQAADVLNKKYESTILCKMKVGVAKLKSCSCKASDHYEVAQSYKNDSHSINYISVML